MVKLIRMHLHLTFSLKSGLTTCIAFVYNMHALVRFLIFLIINFCFLLGEIFIKLIITVSKKNRKQRPTKSKSELSLNTCR